MTRDRHLVHDRVVLHLSGTPCAECGHPAAFLTASGRVHHLHEIGKPPCNARPVEATR